MERNPIVLVNGELKELPTGDTVANVVTNYPGKTLVWAAGILTEVLLYLDAAKTQLAEHRVLNRTTGVLTSINFFDGAGTPVKTRTLSYSSGVLTSVTEA